MAKAEAGDTVRVHYTGRTEDGRVFDSSDGREPLEFTLGGGEVIAGFERAVAGMEPGERKIVTIPADEAFGPYLSELVVEVEREEFPGYIDPVVGQRLQMSRGGQVFVVTVAEVSDTSVVLDGNHPLAGHDLTFEVQLVEIL